MPIVMKKRSTPAKGPCLARKSPSTLRLNEIPSRRASERGRRFIFSEEISQTLNIKTLRQSSDVVHKLASVSNSAYVHLEGVAELRIEFEASQADAQSYGSAPVRLDSFAFKFVADYRTAKSNGSSAE
jgi:hypothetical protein